MTALHDELLDARLRADAAALRRPPASDLARAVRAELEARREAAGAAPRPARWRARRAPLAAAAGLALALGAGWLARRPAPPAVPPGRSLVEALLPSELRATWAAGMADLRDPLRTELDSVLGDARRLADNLVERVPRPLRSLSFLGN